MKAPGYAAAASEDLLTGELLLRRAFLAAPLHTGARNAVIVSADDRAPAALLFHRGFAYRSLSLPDGRRAILDILIPTDVTGLDHAVLGGGGNHEIVAANAVSYRRLSAQALRELMKNPQVALRVLALMGEARWRIDRHMAAITRFDARGRIAALLLGIYERLRRNELISRPTYNLPLTQELLADYLGITMVHVSRTLRRMREERLVLVDRQVVIILDLEGLRRAASGIPPLNVGAAPMPQSSDELAL
ncbi:MAG TPA: Crp/Fnr family transcriptional regulator [Stellaceae bacterium]|nr:Crp/Fnr family transcriptional regulator [Stellaceae bacterium]